MAYVSLFSGGKDSTLALWVAQKEGIEVSKLVAVKAEREDSYMFHRPNIEQVPKLAEALDIELVQVNTKGEKERELEDLKKALNRLNIEGVISGAVASTYQADRINAICKDLHLDHYSPLWGTSQEDVMNYLINEGFKTIIVAVAAYGMDEKWLGREIDENCLKDLKDLNEKYMVNIAGEGGEYETLVLDGPNFRWGFEVKEGNKHWDGHRGTYEVTSMDKKLF